MNELEKILEEIEAEHPYKVPGNYDSYSQYIVEGSEIGSFWTKEEYDKRNCHNKLGHVIS